MEPQDVRETLTLCKPTCHGFFTVVSDRLSLASIFLGGRTRDGRIAAIGAPDLRQCGTYVLGHGRDQFGDTILNFSELGMVSPELFNYSGVRYGVPGTIRRDSHPQGFSERFQSSSLFLPSKAYLTQGHHT